LIRDGFYDPVAAKWEAETRGTTTMEKWQNKIRSLRQILRGWAKNIAGHNKQEKKVLISMIVDLYKKAESNVLSDHELNLRRFKFIFREKKLLNGTRELKLKTSWKVMTTLNISIWSLTENIETTYLQIRTRRGSYSR
jgi:hypothetical protein